MGYQRLTCGTVLPHWMHLLYLLFYINLVLLIGLLRKVGQIWLIGAHLCSLSLVTHTVFPSPPLRTPITVTSWSSLIVAFCKISLSLDHQVAFHSKASLNMTKWLCLKWATPLHWAVFWKARASLVQCTRAWRQSNKSYSMWARRMLWNAALRARRELGPSVFRHSWGVHGTLPLSVNIRKYNSYWERDFLQWCSRV